MDFKIKGNQSVEQWGGRQGSADRRTGVPGNGDLRISHGLMNYGRYILLCVLFLAIAVTPLFAQGGYSEFERDLQLSEAQRTRVEETKRKYMNELQSLNQDYVNKRLELRENDRNPSAAPERRQRIRAELRAIENSRHNLYNQYRSDVSSALNQEQRNRYNSFVDTEQRRTVMPPQNPSAGWFASPPMERASPPMERVSPPVIDGRSVTPPAGRAAAPPFPPQYRSMVPPVSRSMAVPSPRPQTAPPPRGYGR
jgi:hypothetical protein